MSALAPYIAEDNRVRQRVVVGVLTAWIVASLVIDLAHFVPAGERYYLYLDLAVLPVVTTFFLLGWAHFEHPSIRNRTVALFSVLILTWTAVLTAFQGTPYTLFILAFFISATVLLPPARAVVAYGVAFAGYVLGMVILSGSPFARGTTQFLEVLAMQIAACTISALLYRQRQRTLLAEALLRRTGEQQEREIAARTDALNQRLAEREVLLREIHHRVKNNLQVLASMLRLSDEYRPDDDPEAFLRGAERRIVSMALVHEHLYDTENLDRVDLADYLGRLCGYVVDCHETASDMAVNLEIERVTVPVDVGANLGLIVTELLSNSLRHAFPDDQTDRSISVSTATRDGRLEVVVRDNGRGLCRERDQGDGRAGLGLVLVDALARQLDAVVSYDCDGGTIARLEMSLSPGLL